MTSRKIIGKAILVVGVVFDAAEVFLIIAIILDGMEGGHGALLGIIMFLFLLIPAVLFTLIGLIMMAEKKENRIVESPKSSQLTNNISPSVQNNLSIDQTIYPEKSQNNTTETLTTEEVNNYQQAKNKFFLYPLVYLIVSLINRFYDVRPHLSFSDAIGRAVELAITGIIISLVLVGINYLRPTKQNGVVAKLTASIFILGLFISSILLEVSTQPEVLATLILVFLCLKFFINQTTVEAKMTSENNKL